MLLNRQLVHRQLVHRRPKYTSLDLKRAQRADLGIKYMVAPDNQQAQFLACPQRCPRETLNHMYQTVLRNAAIRKLKFLQLANGRNRVYEVIGQADK